MKIDPEYKRHSEAGKKRWQERKKRMVVSEKPLEQVKSPVSHDVSFAKTLPRMGCGVYFLINRGEVVFVGSASEISRKILRHHRREFDDVVYVSTSKEERISVESAFIAYFDPRHNRRVDMSREHERCLKKFLK